MASHVAGFFKNVNAATYQTLTPMADDLLRAENDDLIIPSLNLVNGIMALGSGTVQAEIDAPSLRSVVLEDVARVLDAAELPGDQAVNEGGSATYTIYQNDYFNDYMDNPLVLKATEKAKFKVINGGAVDNYGFLFLTDKAGLTPLKGNIRTVHGTFPATSVFKTWESKVITLDQDLPAGKYSLVGAKIIANHGLVGRFVPVGAGWRPGLPCSPSRASRIPDYFRRGGMGSWIDFDNLTLPNLEIVSTQATTGNEIYLDIIQTGA